MPERYVTVCAVGDLPDGALLTVEADGRPLAVCNVGGTLFAVDDMCPHAGASLGGGRLEGTRVVCPFHAARFDLATGDAVSGPTEHGLATYPVRVADGRVEVALPD
jgi:nitrite reductase/ring-hydroxylating ferredoxin subunit